MTTRIALRKRKFRRQDYHRYKKLGRGWRRPRGKQSKLRIEKAGNSPVPKVGYGRAKAERYRINGMRPVLVCNIPDLGKIGDGECAVISSTVGLKKFATIFEKAKSMNLTILNAKRAKEIAKRQKRIDMAKKEKTEKKSGKKKEENKEKPDTKEKKDENKTEETSISKSEKEEIREEMMKKEGQSVI